MKRQTLWAAIVCDLPSLALPGIGFPKASVSTSDVPLATHAVSPLYYHAAHDGDSHVETEMLT